MQVFAEAAARWGSVDPNDERAVQDFFEKVVPAMSKKVQQRIFDEVFVGGLGHGHKE
ncbi:MAG: hypothetical protein OJF52_001821 [Nitrospira sp.]|nr:MAG: hypothetical protein OJF52_001821 [Nitrospira sp.]